MPSSAGWLDSRPRARVLPRIYRGRVRLQLRTGDQVGQQSQEPPFSRWKRSTGPSPCKVRTPPNLGKHRRDTPATVPRYTTANATAETAPKYHPGKDYAHKLHQVIMLYRLYANGIVSIAHVTGKAYRNQHRQGRVLLILHPRNAPIDLQLIYHLYSITTAIQGTKWGSACSTSRFMKRLRSADLHSS